MEQDNGTEETKLDIELNSQAESQKQGEEDFIQWISRLLIENQRQIKNQPIEYFQLKSNQDIVGEETQNKSHSSNEGMGAGGNAAVAGGIPFVSSLTIKHLYEVLNVRQSHNIEFQAFFALL